MTTQPGKGQPLYIPPAERVTLDELKERAARLQDLALVKSKRAVREVYEQDVTRAALVALGVVVVAASLAFYLGTRVSRQLADTNLPPA